MNKKEGIIQIGKNIYIYFISEELTKKPFTSEMVWKNTLQVQIEEQPASLLLMEFLAKDDYYMGNTLTKEIVLNLNICAPNIIRKLIEWALQNGWPTEKTTMQVAKGMDVFRDLGFDVDGIDAAKDSNYHEFLLEEE